MGLFSPFLRKQRYEAALPHIKGDVLDLGCGITALPEFLANRKIRINSYTGIDVSEDAVRQSRSAFPQHRFYALNLEQDNLPQADKFDTILMLAVIEHIKNPKNALAQCLQHLKDGGLLVITTPTPLGNTIHRLGSKINLTSKEAAEEHCNIYSEQALKALMESSGFETVRYKKLELCLNQSIACKRR